ncbi:MAG: NfeD family protein [Chlamydiota bacterium]
MLITHIRDQLCKFSFLLAIVVSLCTALKADPIVVLNGHLGRNELAAARQALTSALMHADKPLLLQIHSSSGHLGEVLRFAQELAEIRQSSGKQVIAYIQGKAVGPAAVFPFLADRLIVTPLVAWGDITYGQSRRGGIEVLSKTVKQFVADSAPHELTMRHLVDAMVDPRYQLVEEKQVENLNAAQRLDPLILNREGLESLQLIRPSDVMTDDEFAATYLSVNQRRGAMTRSQQTVSSSDSSGLQKDFERYLRYSRVGENLVGYLDIGQDRSIDQTTYLYVKFALENYKKRGVSCVILRLNTPGGEVLSSLKIVDLLQEVDVNNQIPVIAFIDNWAVSAGAMLAYSCRFIGIVPDALMGAAEPVLTGQQGEMVSASEKVNSVLRTEFTNLANFYGRNPLIAKAMVDKDLILVVRNHEIVELKNETDIRLEGSNPDQVITTKGKLLTLNGKQLMEFKVADFMVPLRPIAPLTAKEKEQGEWPATKNLVFQEPYLAAIPNATIITYSDWRLSLFSFLSHPAIAGLLLLGLIIGFYIEINTPGFGVPGAIGVGCLALILLSSFAIEAINWIEVIILIAGIVLLLLELFVIPGFGITGILGITLTVIGLFALMLPSLDKLSLFDPDAFRLIGSAFFKRLAWLSGALILAVVVIVVLARFFSHRFFRFSKLILTGEQQKSDGYLAGIPREKMPEVGELGETVTPLRPSGKVHVGDNLFDAITQGNYLEAYVAVEVIRIEGSKVVVREVEGREE